MQQVNQWGSDNDASMFFYVKVNSLILQYSSAVHKSTYSPHILHCLIYSYKECVFILRFDNFWLFILLILFTEYHLFNVDTYMISVQLVTPINIYIYSFSHYNLFVTIYQILQYVQTPLSCLTLIIVFNIVDVCQHQLYTISCILCFYA